MAVGRHAPLPAHEEVEWLCTGEASSGQAAQLDTETAAVLRELRATKRAMWGALLLAGVVLAGAVGAVCFRGAAGRGTTADRDELVQLSAQDEMKAHLASIQHSSADAEAKLEAGAAAIAGRLWQGSQDGERPEHTSEGGEASAGFKAKQQATSQGNEADQNEVIRQKMRVQMEALKEAQERIKKVTEEWARKADVEAARQHRQRLNVTKDKGQEFVVCNGYPDNATLVDKMEYETACAPTGWYRVYIDTIMREGESFDTPIVRTLPTGTLVHITEMRGRRVKVDKVGNQPEDAVPMSGWISRKTPDHVIIIRPSRGAIMWEQIVHGNHSTMGKVFQNAKLLAARKGFAEQFKNTARATRAQHELSQKLKQIDTQKLATGLSRLEADKAKTEEAIEDKVVDTGKGVAQRVEQDAGKLVNGLDDAPVTQKLLKGVPKVLEKEVQAKVHPEELLSHEGKNILGSLGAELGR